VRTRRNWTGEERAVTLSLEKRVIANWLSGKWSIEAGNYGFAAGASAEALGTRVSVSREATEWGEKGKRSGAPHCG
jgi:beta-glucosidase